MQATNPTPSRTPRPLTADDVLTAKEVAVLLHAPVSTVEDWARRGILPPPARSSAKSNQ